MEKLVITLTGPTASGKTTLERQLQAQGWGRAISHTTREPRAGEVNGSHYHFVTMDEYLRMEEDGEFIETIELGSVCYAMSAKSLQEARAASQKGVVIVVEPNGAQQIHDFCHNHMVPVMAVWIEVNPQVQAYRWLERVVADHATNGKTLKASAERLTVMIAEESRWSRCANAGVMLDGETEYDLKLDSTSLSAEQLASEIEKASSQFNWVD